MTADDTNKWFPPANPAASMPFYYASLTTYWVYYQVDLDVLTPYVGDAYAATDIGGRGLVVVNPQLYTSIFNNGQELTTETEFDIVVHPKSEAGRAPIGMSLADYLIGNDQTKLIGNLRLHVACDDQIAVDAGKAAFGEPKFLTTFAYNIPAVNAPGQESWSWKCNDPDHADQFIFDLEIAPLTTTPVWANPSPITGYTYLDGRPVGSRWNPLAPYLQFDAIGTAQTAISFGGSTHPMRTDMQTILGTAQAVAVQVMSTPPVCIESGPYYVDP